MVAPIAQNIILVGLMGSGKTSLARSLSRKTGCRMVDTDAVIEKMAGMPTTQIFAEKGEAWFRDAETELLAEYLDKSGCILSTGGGMIIRETNRKMMRQLGFVTWLHASENITLSRVSRNNDRPLLHTADPRATLRELMILREPWYREVAHLDIDTGLISRSEATQTILQMAGWPCQTS